MVLTKILAFVASLLLSSHVVVDAADCADSAIWALTNLGQPVRSLDGVDETLDGNYVQITGRYYNEAVAIDAQDGLWRFFNGQWSRLAGAAVWASIGVDGSIWVVNRPGFVYSWDTARNEFIEVSRSNAKFISVHSATRVAITDTKNSVSLWIGGKWVLQSGSCEHGQIDATEVYCGSKTSHILPGTAGNAVWAVTLSGRIVRSWDGGRDYVAVPFVPAQVSSRSYYEAVAVDDRGWLWQYVNSQWHEVKSGFRAAWGSIGIDGSLWAIGPDHRTFRWDVASYSWVVGPGSTLKSIHVHSALRILSTSINNELFLWDGVRWTLQPGKCAYGQIDASKIYCDWSSTHVLPSGEAKSDQAVAAGEALWAITLDGAPVRGLNGVAGTLSPDRKYVQISGRSYDEAVAVCANDKIWHFAHGKWQEFQNGAQAVWASIGIDGTVYVVSRNGLLFVWDSTAGNFVFVPSSNVKYVHVYSALRVVVTSKSRDVAVWSGSNWSSQSKQCDRAQIDATDIYCDASATHNLPTASDASVWAVTLSGQLVRSLNNKKDHLTTTFVPVQVSGRSFDEAVAVDDKDQIWHFDGKAWSQYDLAARAKYAAIGQDGTVWIIDKKYWKYYYWNSTSGSFVYAGAYDGATISVFNRDKVLLTNSKQDSFVPSSTYYWYNVNGNKCESASLDALRYYCDSAATHVMPSGVPQSTVTPSLATPVAKGISPFVSTPAPPLVSTPAPPLVSTPASVLTTGSIAVVSTPSAVGAPFAYSDSKILTFTSIVQRDGLLQQIVNLVKSLLAALGLVNLNIVSVKDVALSGGNTQVFYKITGQSTKPIDVSSVLNSLQGILKTGDLLNPFDKLGPNHAGGVLQSGKDFALVDSALLTYTSVAQRDGLLQVILKLLQGVLDLLFGTSNLKIVSLAEVADKGDAKQVLYQISGQTGKPFDVSSVLGSLHTSIGNAGVAGLGNAVSNLVGAVVGALTGNVLGPVVPTNVRPQPVASF